MRKELGNIKEPTDFEGTVKELAEQVLDLSTKQPDGMIHDEDTILADIMEAADFQVSGISDDILKLYLEVENKDDFESLFYLITDEKFEDYLVESKKVMEENILKAEPRAIQVYLSDSGNDEKESIILTLDEDENEEDKVEEDFGDDESFDDEDDSEEPDHDPKYDEDIDYDQYDEYYEDQR